MGRGRGGRARPDRYANRTRCDSTSGSRTRCSLQGKLTEGWDEYEWRLLPARLRVGRARPAALGRHRPGRPHDSRRRRAGSRRRDPLRPLRPGARAPRRARAVALPAAARAPVSRDPSPPRSIAVMADAGAAAVGRRRARTPAQPAASAPDSARLAVGQSSRYLAPRRRARRGSAAARRRSAWYPRIGFDVGRESGTIGRRQLGRWNPEAVAPLGRRRADAGWVCLQAGLPASAPRPFPMADWMVVGLRTSPTPRRSSARSIGQSRWIPLWRTLPRRSARRCGSSPRTTSAGAGRYVAS